ncbi:MAG: ribosome small subunit-dependent GTPase A [Parachlamydiaceae bacterium]|nr:ribosome small subunit-dependent GTPase A [Parachlamydiaceae bacterium]
MKKKSEQEPKLPKRWVKCSTEEEYFGDERKSSKAERKRVKAKDRSKYKKTDVKKQEQQVQVFDPKALERGRVLSIASQGIYVQVGEEIILCTLRGLLKKDKTQFKNLVTVGDFVFLERDIGGHGLIAQVETRRTVLSRAENLSRRKEQLIASNIDQVIIVVSVVSPPLKPSLVDRYIIAAQKGGMEPVVVVNKIDLLETSTESDPTLEEEKQLYIAFLKAYQEAGIRVIPLSAVTKEGLEDLKLAMKDKASVFSGQSGVGKSSLINMMTGKNLRVGGMVDKTNKGTHTTTTAQLLPLEFGGWCIDTPGIKSFGVWHLDQEEIKAYFPEIFEYGRNCRYPDCSHLSEESCAVIKAVEEGKISILRYTSYFALMESVANAHFRR